VAGFGARSRWHRAATILTLPTRDHRSRSTTRVSEDQQ
jgi:hypothetical protein